MNYVYLGNVPGHPLKHTYCPECGQIVVERLGFDITGWHLDKENRCTHCGLELLGQKGFPLLRCPRCDQWFELQIDGSIVPLWLDALARFC